jgi:aspartate/methionine/tyrosine aminotransferase
VPAISKRTEALGTENAFVVLAEVGELQARGKDIVSFCIGQPDFPTPPNITAAAIDAINAGHHGYTPSPGIPALREAVAKYFSRTRGVEIAPEDVVVGCGGKPFISYTVLSVTDYGAGHEVIYPNPGFPIYQSQIAAQGAVPVPLPLREARGFNFDPQELADRINDKTRLLILCSPGNPNGNVLSRDELKAVAEIVRPYENLWIYSDEVYSGLAYDDDFRSIAAEEGMLERTVIADSASKTFAMTGWRIGYAANRALAPSFTRWVTNTDSCPPHPNQYAVVEALNGSQEHVRNMHDVFKKRRTAMVDGLNAIEGVECQLPGGAFYVWPNVTEACRMIGAASSEEFRKRLLHEAGIAVLADIHFGDPVPGEGQHIRFSYASSLEAIEEGLQRMEAFILKNKQSTVGA